MAHSNREFETGANYLYVQEERAVLSCLQMNRWSSRINRLEFKASGNLPIILEESIEECTSNE